MHVDGARVAVGAVAPDARQQHVARPHAARGARRARQDLELDEGQRDLVAARPDRRAWPGRSAARATSSGGLGRRVAPARLIAARRSARLDAAAELAHRERLGDVVVGAELEAEDLVDLLRLGGQHDDRHRAARPQAPADLEAVDARHHHVEDDEVEGVLGEALERLLAVDGRDDLVAVLPQRDRRGASGSTARRRRAGCVAVGRPSVAEEGGSGYRLRLNSLSTCWIRASTGRRCSRSSSR